VALQVFKRALALSIKFDQWAFQQIGQWWGWPYRAFLVRATPEQFRTELERPRPNRSRLTKDDLELMVEMRRGLAAANGAALVSIIGLLSTKLDPSTVRLGAWLFFAGLCAAMGFWIAHLLIGGSNLQRQDGAILFKRASKSADTLEAWCSSLEGRWAWYSLNLQPMNTLIGVFGVFCPFVSFGSFVAGCVVILRSLPTP